MTNNSDSSLPKKVAIIYSDVRRRYFATEDEYIAEAGADVYASAIAQYVLKMGIDVVCLACDDQIANNLKNINQIWF